jgi:hypothetical protein
MKLPHLIIASCLFSPLTRAADEVTPEERLAMHREAADKIADEQDELSADVQQLVIEQTAPKVIELLNGVENIMDEATERLAEADTGGETIAAQTEIIELIHAAAKEKQSQGGGGKSGGAMMDMMERMMGKKPGAGPNGKGNGEKASDTGSNGQTGLSDTGNEATNGQGGGNNETRRVPKAAGATSAALPEEFRKAFDAYNRGAEEKVK